MDILTAAAITFPCDNCGKRFAVTLQQIHLSQDIVSHNECLFLRHGTECPPAVFATLIDRPMLGDLVRAWQRVEDRARAKGGELSVCESGGEPSAAHDQPHKQPLA